MKQNLAGCRVAVLGGNGMLGSDLVAVLTATGALVQVLDLPDWNITCDAHLQQAVDDADILINCAAYTNVDGAETNRELCRAVNSSAPARLAELAAKKKRYLLHISTDFVFDGRKVGAYMESDTPNPLNVYGATKLAGEQAVLAAAAENCVVRIQWTYGHAGQNFISRILERAANGDALRVVNDQVGAPTPTTDVAAALTVLTQQRISGLFHYAARGFASRWDVAVCALRLLGRDVPVLPCASSDFVTPAERPLNSRFDCAKIDAIPGIVRQQWQDALKTYLETTS